jgi:hypothetical protein
MPFLFNMPSFSFINPGALIFTQDCDFLFTPNQASSRYFEKRGITIGLSETPS